MTQVLKLGSKNFNLQNWKVFHPNGKHMFTCGEKRAEWYLNKVGDDGKKLAKKIGDFKIQLNYVPKGNGFKEDEIFGLSDRIIRCVVTGENENLQRHHIVPYCYRTHFKEEYKSKNHHDVVLVTYKIHEIYEKYAIEFKNQLANKYNVKTLSEINLEYTKLIYDYSNDKIKMLSRFFSIFKYYNNIPQNSIIEALEHVSLYCDVSFENLCKLNYIQLYKLYTILKKKYDQEFEEFKFLNKQKYDHGYHLVQKLDTDQKIENFIKKWRKHFIDTMNPLYMPKGWSIDFKYKVEIS